MSGVLAGLRWELKIQYRQGILWAALFVMAIWVLILFSVSPQARAILLPYAIFMDLSVFGMYFAAGLFYLEKDEGSLEAVVVSPQPRGRYLLIKVIALELLSLSVTALLTLLVWRGPVNWFYLLLGTLLNGWIMCMLGFILGARYNSINELIMPSILYFFPLQLPALDHFGAWSSWLLYLLPTQGPMLLLAGAFGEIAAWQVVYAIVYGFVVCAALSWIALRTFEKFVVRKRGSE